MKILVVVERTDSGYSAFAPDVPGCVATGASRQDVERAIAEAMELHFDGLRAEGISAPEPQSYATVIEVAA